MYPKVLSTYSSVSGDLESREEMARYFMDKQGITVHPEERHYNRVPASDRLDLAFACQKRGFSIDRATDV